MRCLEPVRITMPVTGCDESGSLRIHGRAEASATPEGNRNALEHGRYSAEAMARR
jgi:hypothetical protein